jgi:hypothetical protein
VNEVAQFLNSVSGPKYNTGLAPLSPVDVAPIVGLNGYQQSSQAPGRALGQSAGQAAQSSTSMGSSSPSPTLSGSLFSSPSLGPSSSHYQFDANTGTANQTTGNADIGAGISALGLMGQLTHNPMLSQVAGLGGTIYGASNGDYTGLGGMLGKLSGVPGGSLLGAALGNWGSENTNTPRFLANAGISMIPGLGQLYSLGNMVTNGALSNSLFGKDSTIGDTGAITPATTGIVANLGNPNASRIFGTGSNAVTVSNSGNSHSTDGSSTTGNMNSSDRASISAANGGGGGV